MEHIEPFESSESGKSSEMNERVKEILLAFQAAKASENEEDRGKLIQDFYQKLRKLVTPENEEFFAREDRDLIDNVLEGRKEMYLAVGGGTSGQRISFKNSIFAKTEEDAKKYGYDLESTEFAGSYELESLDGKPRWMVYGKPEGSDWSHGQRYWERFVSNFGDEVVDLLQKVEAQN